MWNPPPEEHTPQNKSEFDGVQQFQFQTSQFFPPYIQVWNMYELIVWGDRKKDVNQTKLRFHTHDTL